MDKEITASDSCISFDSYIKPQLLNVFDGEDECCISFDSYIKPQLQHRVCDGFVGCISFDSYIKPQLLLLPDKLVLVVYLLIPTSNHNSKMPQCTMSMVVYLLIPTSNHNSNIEFVTALWLYIF